MLDGTSRVVDAPERELDGRWTNGQGSLLDLEVHATGWVTGTFRAASDGSSYRPYRVTGTYTERPEGGRGVVGSVLAWPWADSVTVWTGEYDPRRDELRTSWLMAAGDGRVGQHGLSVGEEVFRKIAGHPSMARAGGGPPSGARSRRAAIRAPL